METLNSTQGRKLLHLCGFFDEHCRKLVDDVALPAGCAAVPKADTFPTADHNIGQSQPECDGLIVFGIAPPLGLKIHRGALVNPQP